jgi:hypothetical protein
MTNPNSNPLAAPSEIGEVKQMLKAVLEMLVRPKQYPEIPITPREWDKTRGEQYPETKTRLTAWMAQSQSAGPDAKVPFPPDLDHAYRHVGELQMAHSNFNGVFALDFNGCVELALHMVTWVLQTQVRNQAAAQGRPVEEVWADLMASSGVVPPPVPVRGNQEEQGQQETAAGQDEVQAVEGTDPNEAQHVNSVSGEGA